MSTFNETCEPTSRKYVAKQGIVMSRWLKTFQTFRLHFPVFALETQPKILNFQSFFTSNRLFGGYFQWNAFTDFQKTCSRTRYRNAKWIKNISNFLVAPLRFFPLEKQPKNINCRVFFTSNRPFGGYFQWNACRDFQKICIWARYSDAKFIKNISKFWVALLHFSCRKTTGKSKFSESFLLLIGPLEKQPKNLHFQSFFSSNKPFGGYFQ